MAVSAQPSCRCCQQRFCPSRRLPCDRDTTGCVPSTSTVLETVVLLRPPPPHTGPLCLTLSLNPLLPHGLAHKCPHAVFAEHCSAALVGQEGMWGVRQERAWSLPRGLAKLSGHFPKHQPRPARSALPCSQASKAAEKPQAVMPGSRGEHSPGSLRVLGPIGLF